MGKRQRKTRNVLLQPFVQMRIGLVNVAASLIFVLALGFYAYRRLVAFSDVVATLTQADSEVKSLLASYLTSVGLTAIAGTAVFFAANLGLSVYLTHKLVGPTIAFRRHIRALASGDFRARTTLRTGDAFVEVADELNVLSEKLSTMIGPPKA